MEEALITEIIGDGEGLKAFKLDNGKVIGTGLMIYAIQTQPATEFLKDSGVSMNNGYIVIDEAMMTNYPGVFACGQACRSVQDSITVKSHEQVNGEGARAAGSLLALLERGSVSCPTYSSS
jgi:thioredoxin reductase